MKTIIINIITIFHIEIMKYIHYLWFLYYDSTKRYQ